MKRIVCGRDCARCQRCPNKRTSRREFLKQIAASCLILGSGLGVSACVQKNEQPVPETRQAAQPATPSPLREAELYRQPYIGHLPSGLGKVEIQDIGSFEFDAGTVQTIRPDIFRAGHFSVFDILIHLAQDGQIKLSYHMDESMNTHVIDKINGQKHWWHEAYYSGGWPERNVFRADMYPYKNETRIHFLQRRESDIEIIYSTFQQEVQRLNEHKGQVILPQLDIHSPVETWHFEDVEVQAHNMRGDVLQPGVITALDALLSLSESGDLPAIDLKWYDHIAKADPVDNYWVEGIGDAQGSGGCGFVYETGPLSYKGFSGSHIHIPADVRVTVSPEYALWFWICL